MKEVMRDDAFGREDAPPELRLPPVHRRSPPNQPRTRFS